eukprot:3679557-Rhodomonas_salina.1
MEDADSNPSSPPIPSSSVPIEALCSPAPRPATSGLVPDSPPPLQLTPSEWKERTESSSARLLPYSSAVEVADDDVLWWGARRG